MRDQKELRNFWREHEGEQKILSTIVRKNGSGYRNIGAKKLILKDGRSAGYLSGGCMEGDIIRTAQERWDDVPFIVSFSTMSDEDRLMGYQTGCAGILDILFERLPEDMHSMDLYIPYGANKKFDYVGLSLDQNRLATRSIDEKLDGEHFIDEWVEPLQLYVLGCGGNAIPFADLAVPMGWDVTFLDYRQGNVIEGRPDVESKIIPLTEFGANIKEGARSAVVVNTHNYEADLDIVTQINGKEFGYIGCLGPRNRFELMREDALRVYGVRLDPEWSARVHAPAGLKKARSPEDIAFSIMAEIQFKMNVAT